MKTKSHIYILPGGAGRNDAHWYTWLERKLTKDGFSVVVCSQNVVSPFKRAQQLLERYPLDAHTTLVGHSFGGLAALKWIELADQPVAGLILVDVSVKKSFESIPRKLLEQVGTAQKRQNLRRLQRRYLYSWNWKVDLPAVSRQVPRVMLLSEDRTAEMFPDWRPEHEKMATVLRAKLVTGNGVKQHFTAKQEPKVLAATQQLLSR